MSNWYIVEVHRNTFITQFVWTNPPLSHVLQVVSKWDGGPDLLQLQLIASCLGNEGSPYIFPLYHFLIAFLFSICSFIAIHRLCGFWMLCKLLCIKCKHLYIKRTFHILLYLYINSKMINVLSFHYISILYFPFSIQFTLNIWYMQCKT